MFRIMDTTRCKPQLALVTPLFLLLLMFDTLVRGVVTVMLV
jgi:hypothetical protein